MVRICRHTAPVPVLTRFQSADGSRGFTWWTRRIVYCTPLTLSQIFHRFCGLKGHEMFCEVERSYIEDGFNLYGLRACVSNFSDCLDLILDRIGPDDDSDDSHLTQSACTLYGLIHARYIITAHGLDAMYNKVRTDPWRCCLVILVWCTVYCVAKDGTMQNCERSCVARSSLLCESTLWILTLTVSSSNFSMPQRNLERVHWYNVRASLFFRLV
jgi:Casein kinase II regulatory subunit